MTFSSCNPATGVGFYSRPAWTPAQLDASIAALRAVQPAWRRLPVAERGHALRALSQQLLAHADELASHAEHVEEAAAARRNAEEMEELEARKARMLAEIRDLEREEARLGTQMGRRRVAPIAEPEGPHGPGRPA